MSEVLVVGAGPVGLTLAAELARHGARPRIIDRAPSPSPYCRAIGVTPRTLEIFEDMGVARDMTEAGLWLTGLRSIVGGAARDAMKPDLGLPYAELGLPQYETERILTRHLARLGIAVERGVALSGLRQDDEGVSVTLSGPEGASETARFRYVVGCDGAHSAVRHALSIGFEGEAYPWPFMLGDVRIDWDLPYGMALRALRLVEGGPPDMFIAIPLPEKGRYRVSMLAPAGSASGGSDHGIQDELPGPSLTDLQAVADDLVPERPRLSDLRWSSLYRISMRLAANYRVGRAFIAGDAAHIHPPTGGQGMNTGIGDAYNLAWKLARVLRGEAPAALLDSYEAERRPVGAAVVARTQAASESYGREGGGSPSRAADSQVDITYRGTPFVSDEGDPDAPGPRAGDRAPDAGGLRRHGIGFPLRLFDLLRGTDDVVLVQTGADVAAAEHDEIVAWAAEAERGRAVRIVVVTPSLRPEPLFVSDAGGAFASAYGSGRAAYLIRPDGHIAWRGRSWRDEGIRARAMPAD
ncbi:FAD-dependent monooxygenase [Enterovirga rhinocerotis]|uniref:2-polyprenyl-6-methoxyphenol hydroxylase-like FAD-dependent oxidoreductase n=1 Tax=Enterovirga rhinocerotis TaxID=1339210 RepID=A0A4R7BRB7_9HYPH|nr:FAD-dependent monooxygenase [Enterovirga rhinocerotis]TDR87332.1 2-polyprenyl-6-methoxyphenol hydroxylase-like FAD-dependent oxidoreductase [Enterovirga rhinocerotis]